MIVQGSQEIVWGWPLHLNRAINAKYERLGGWALLFLNVLKQGVNFSSATKNSILQEKQLISNCLKKTVASQGYSLCLWQKGF